MRTLLAVLLLTVSLIFTAPAPAQDPAPAKPADPDAALKKLLDASKADATRIRRLEFLSDVPVRRITKDDFKRLMKRDIGRVFGEGNELGNMEKLLKLLRVIPGDIGLMELLDRFFPESVAANYDPFANRISFLKGFRSKSIMVHELTHALQDQHFNLELMALTGEMTFDRLLALGGLAEGDAENVQQMHDTAGMLAATPLETIRAIGTAGVESYLARKKDFPMGIARPFIFQYLNGILFVETVKRAGGGYKAIDRVYRDPPVSTEQILHPERYLERDHPTRILAPKPPAPYETLVENVLGELGVSIVLAGHLGDAYVPAMAEGWDGDRVLLLGAEGRTPLLVWYTTWDSEKDAVEFAGAAKKMLEMRLASGGGERSFTLSRSGVDVLLVEGAPKAEEQAILAALKRAGKEEIRLVRTLFGGAK